MRTQARWWLAGGALLVIALTGSLEASIPSSVHFQGILKDGAGNPVSDGSYLVTFRIYSAATGGDTLWSDTQTVVTTDGVFQAVLGQSNPITSQVFADPSPYLGVTVSPEPEMSPRQKWHAVAYALRVSTIAGASGGVLSGDVLISGDLAVGGEIEASGTSNKVRFEFDMLGDLPDPTLFDGMFAHVHSLGRAYFAHDGVWVPLADSSHKHSTLSASDGSPLAIYVDTAGLVGIGTTAPKAMLEVNGDVIRSIARAVGYGNDETDAGELAGRTLVFTKKQSSTGVRVTYTDNMRVYSPSSAAAGRWEVLFNGAACANPGPLVYDYYDNLAGHVLHRSQTVCGTCFGLPAGSTTIQIRVVDVPSSVSGDRSTGWNNSYWSIEAEEVR